MRTAAGETEAQIALRLLQRGSGGKSIYKILVKGEFNAIKCLLYKRFSASQGADIIMKGFSAFLDMKRCKDWDHEIGS